MGGRGAPREKVKEDERDGIKRGGKGTAETGLTLS